MLLFGEVCADGGRASRGSAAARHSARDVVTAQKSAEVIVVVAVEAEATKDRTSRNGEELCAARLGR